MSKRIWVAAAAGLLTVAAACTGQQDVTHGDIVDDLVEDAGESREAADCVADAVFDEFRQVEINEIDGTDAVDELDEPTRERLEEIYEDCDVTLE